MDKETVAVRDEDVEAVQCERGTAYMGALDEREHWQCPRQDIRTNPNRTSTEVLVLPFVFPCRICSHHPPNLQLLVFSRLFAARVSHSIGKHHSSLSTTRIPPQIHDLH
ncbi:hypothetical protein C8J56DRAFT_1174806 [Mycena floridula]|nr:hypothetical protein C8J56DRAFT_1174806 [Mycena floridula]